MWLKRISCVFRQIETTDRAKDFDCSRKEKYSIRVEIKLPYDEVNDSNLKKYKQLVEENYREPVNGKYDDTTDKILEDIGIDDEESEEDSDVEELYELDNSEKDD